MFLQAGFKEPATTDTRGQWQNVWERSPPVRHPRIHPPATTGQARYTAAKKSASQMLRPFLDESEPKSRNALTLRTANISCDAVLARRHVRLKAWKQNTAVLTLLRIQDDRAQLHSWATRLSLSQLPPSATLLSLQLQQSELLALYFDFLHKQSMQNVPG